MLHGLIHTINRRVRVADFNISTAYEDPYTEQKDLAKPPCEKFVKKLDKLNYSIVEKEHVNQKTSEMQQLIDKILSKNS